MRFLGFVPRVLLLAGWPWIMGMPAMAQCDQLTYKLQFDGTGLDVAHRILMHANGDLYVAGYSNSFSANYDLVLARFTSSGVLVWSKRYDVVGDDGGMSMYMATGPSGSLYLGATVSGLNTNQEDGGLVKLDEDGNVLWARRVLPMPFYCQVRAVMERPDGDVIAVGSANSIGAGNADAWAARFTSSGVLVWLNSYGWSGQDHFTHVELLDDGSFTACSQSMGASGGVRKAMVAHIGSDGVPLGCRLHNGGVSDTYNHGVANPDGTYLYVGFTESYGAGGRDVLAVLTSATGDRIWSRTYGTAVAEEGLSAVVDPAGGWRIAAFQGVSRTAHVLHVLGNGDLDAVVELSDVVIPSSASWAQVIERAADGGVFCIGSEVGMSGGGGMSIIKLDACAQTDCGSNMEMWSSMMPMIPELTPNLPVSAVSANVTSVPVIVGEINSAFLAGLELVVCDTCEISLEQFAIEICDGGMASISVLDSAQWSVQTEWVWDMGDGVVLNDAYGVEHTYANSGAYSGLLSVVDTIAGCSATTAFSILVVETPNVSLGPDTILCPGGLFVLGTGLMDAAHLWSTGSQEPAITIGDPGVYWVVVGSQGCSSSDTVYVESPVLPSVDLGPDIMLCDQGGVQLGPVSGDEILWSTGEVSPEIFVDEASQVWVMVAVQGCSVADSLNILQGAVPVVVLPSDTVICGQFQFELEPVVALYPQDWLWSTGGVTPSVLLSESNTYWLSLTNDCGTAIDSIDVLFVEQPIVELGPDQTLCGVDTLILNSGHPASISLWNDSLMAQYNSVHTSGSYWVVVDVDGCIGADTVNVAWSSMPHIVLPPDTVVCESLEIEITVVEFIGEEISWSSGTIGSTVSFYTSGVYVAAASNVCGVAIDSIAIVIAAAINYDSVVSTCKNEALLQLPESYEDVVWAHGAQGATIHAVPGQYEWTAIDAYGCLRSGEIQVVIDTAADGNVFVPNVFTPNQDVINDGFRAYGVDFGAYRLTLFNRWGQEIWSSTDPTESWDGSSSGKEVPDGTYVYILEHTDRCDGGNLPKVKYGHVTLLR
jgi:gliding motility-associated-like protein